MNILLKDREWLAKSKVKLFALYKKDTLNKKPQKVKGWKKLHHISTSQKKDGVAI